MREFKVTERMTIRSSGIDRYLNEISKIPLMTPDEEHKVAIKAATGDREAIDKLVKGNLRFVVSVAKMYNGGNSTMFEDLINEGNHGLVEAAELFDPSKGFKFISYAVWHIRKYMLQYLTNHSRHIKIPLNKVGAIKKMNDIESDLIHELGRMPTSDEVIDQYMEWHITEKGVATKREGLEYARLADVRVSQIERPFQESDESSFSPIDLINGYEIGADHIATSDSTYKMIMPFITKLDYINREIMLCKFGFKNDGESMSFAEIANKLGYSTECIRQRYNKTIRQLKSKMRRENMSIDKFL